MAPLGEQELLAQLDDCGLKVEDDGTVSDWQDRPAAEPRPIRQPNEQRGVRKAFTSDDDGFLQQWCAAAEAEGKMGPRVFRQLETVVSIGPV